MLRTGEGGQGAGEGSWRSDGLAVKSSALFTCVVHDAGDPSFRLVGLVPSMKFPVFNSQRSQHAPQLNPQLEFMCVPKTLFLENVWCCSGVCMGVHGSHTSSAWQGCVADEQLVYRLRHSTRGAVSSSCVSSIREIRRRVAPYQHCQRQPTLKHRFTKHHAFQTLLRSCAALAPHSVV